MRDEVVWFASKMENVLCSKDHLYPKGWIEDEPEHLMFRVQEKLWEMQKSIMDNEGDYKKMIYLSVDIANFAMMIADINNCKRGFPADE